MNKIPVYLEIGKQRAFAGALDWPGWCRSGRDETGALQALYDCGRRYAAVVNQAGMDFHAPREIAEFDVVERLVGDATTDFGAPGQAPVFDEQPLGAYELERLARALRACWQALDKAAVEAVGRELRKGPRGGGRELDAILAHVINAEAAYLRRLGGKFTRDKAAPLHAEHKRLQAEILMLLPAAARGELPAEGPRSGRRWTARYFIRRAAWHVLDHAWEIEDRAETG